MKRPKSWWESLNWAIEGILYAAKTQRHMRYHFLFAVVFLVGCAWLPIDRYGFLALTLAVLLILFAEMINTAMEALVDLVSPETHPVAKIVKDVAAGAVLLAAAGASVVVYVVLSPLLLEPMSAGITWVKSAPYHPAVIALAVVLILVVMSKVYYGRGKPLRGGLPSGHAALAFAIWVAVVWLTADPLSTLLVFVLALLVGQSRVSLGIHSRLEVILGALLGGLATLVLLMVMRV